MCSCSGLKRTFDLYPHSAARSCHVGRNLDHTRHRKPRPSALTQECSVQVVARCVLSMAPTMLADSQRNCFDRAELWSYPI
jgi:hypothetical protein